MPVLEATAAVPCNASYCTTRTHLSVTEAEVCAEVSAYRDECDAIEAAQEQAAERAARNYDECGTLLWDDGALADLYAHPFDPQTW